MSGDGGGGLAPVVVYLTLTLPPFFTGAGGVLPNAVLVVHLGLALGLARAIGWIPGRRELGLGKGIVGRIDSSEEARERWSELRAWLPLAIFPLLYLELPFLHHGVPDEIYRDGVVQGWEAALFPGNPSRTLAAHWNGPGWVEPLSALYLSALIAPVLLAAWLRRRGERRRFERWVIAPTIAWGIVLLVAVWFPVLGPRYGMFAAEDIVGGPFRAAAWQVMLVVSSPGTGFPALITAVGTASGLAAIRIGARPLGLAAIGVALAGGVAAVHGGFHYGVSVVAGVFVGLIAEGVARGLPA